MVRNPYSSFYTWTCTAIGALLGGACAGAGVVWRKSQINYGTEPLSNINIIYGILMFTFIGGMVGHAAASKSTRRCPHCRKPMEKEQGSLYTRRRASRPEGQIQLRTSDTGGQVESHYLCDYCDQEYRLEDIVEFATRRRMTARDSNISASSPQITKSSEPSDAHELETDTAVKKASDNQLVLPDHWTICVTPEKITIVQNQIMMGCLTSLYIALLIPSLGLLAAANIIVGSWIFVLIAIQLLLSIGVGIFVAKRAKKIIEIDHEQLTVSQTMMPWSKDCIDRSNMSQLYCGAIYNAGSRKHNQPEFFTYQVKLLTKNGQRKTIVGDFRTKADAVALEGLLEKFLAIGDKSVSPSPLELELATELSRRHQEHDDLQAIFLFLLLLFISYAFLGFLFYQKSWASNKSEKRGSVNINASNPAQLASPGTQPMGGKTGSALVAEILKNQAEESVKTTLEAIRGFRWKSDGFHRMLLIELREDMTGRIKVDLGPRPYLTTQMTYEVGLDERLESPTLKMTLPDKSQFSVFIRVNEDRSEARMYWPKSTGQTAEIIASQFLSDRFLRETSDSANTN